MLRVSVKFLQTGSESTPIRIFFSGCIISIRMYLIHHLQNTFLQIRPQDGSRKSICCKITGRWVTASLFQHPNNESGSKSYTLLKFGMLMTVLARFWDPFGHCICMTTRSLFSQVIMVKSSGSMAIRDMAGRYIVKCSGSLL